ncbi:MAG: geranylgeranyl diphosphate reductase [Pseudomonadota bacterium]
MTDETAEHIDTAAQSYDFVVIGGGPSGATAAKYLAERGEDVLLVDKEGRIKPCGGAIPTRAIRDFAIPASQIKARANSARIIGPKGDKIAMEIGDIGYVGMVDRDEFDPWLRERAKDSGAEYLAGSLSKIQHNADASITLTITGKGTGKHIIHTRMLIGADGANSAVRRMTFAPSEKPPYVFAYHEIVKTPENISEDLFKEDRCDVIYNGDISPDFYGWVFPHGPCTSVGTGTAVKGHDMREATAKLRAAAGLDTCETIREEGAPLPLKPMKRWDNGKNIILAGDAAGVVAPSSGEGIYYAMLTGELCGQAACEALETGRAKALATARKKFMKEHGRVFFILGLLQAIWYKSDKRRVQFVSMCADPDVQRLTWESYLNKRLVKREPMAHLRVLIKDIQQLLGMKKAA